MDGHGWHKKYKSNDERYMYDAYWTNVKSELVVGEAHFSPEDAVELAEWILRTYPKKKFIMTVELDFDPRDSGNTGRLEVCAFDDNVTVREVWE